MAKEVYNVTGMTCASCSARVEKTVAHLEGVENVAVNLLTNSMEVNYNPSVLNSDTIISAVEKAGYGANLKNQAAKTSSGADISAMDEMKKMKKRLISSLIFLIPLFYISMGHMLGMPLPSFLHGAGNAVTFAFTQFLLVIPILWINFHYFRNGFKNLFHLSPNMDSLIAIGSGASVLYGIFAIYRIGWGYGHSDLGVVARYSMDLYFESAGTILTLITLGKFLESRAKRKTTDAITKLVNLRPKTATVIRNGVSRETDISEVVKGDIVAVKSGAIIPVDGRIIQGSCSIDESVITGESMPVEKSAGDNVTGATINKSGYIEIQATKIGEDSTLNQIIKLVEEASATKAPVAKIADKISGVFVPIVIAVALLSAIVWLLVGESFEFALSTGISVLVISCPCALGLATPTAIMTGTGRSAQMGILIKSAECLETSGKLDTVVLDKTGTVTQGKPQVTDVIPVGMDKQEFLSLAVSVEQLSEHPLAKAVAEYGKKENCSVVAISHFENFSGMGISATTDKDTVLAGNIQLMNRNSIATEPFNDIMEKFSTQGKTPLFFARNQRIIGIIAVADVIKETSKIAVQELKSMNINVVMLTGDNLKTAQAIAADCGIEKVFAEVLPQEKEWKIRQLQNEQHNVAMVGDGINDSPALMRADVGIAIGAGTDIAIESADVVLVKNNLIDIVRLIQLSRKTLKNIKENLFWALIYNSVGIPLASGIFYPVFGWRMNPMYGALAMCFSSVCVVTNALRLRHFTPKFRYYSEDTENFRSADENNIATDTNEETEENTMTKKVIIDGMMCEHCSGRVEQALNKIDGVKASVNLKKKTATVKGDVSDDTIRAVVKEAGYTVVEIQQSHLPF